MIEIIKIQQRCWKKSIDIGQIELNLRRATFWKGGAQYVLDDYTNALLSFKQFVGFRSGRYNPEYKTAITILPTLILND
jgi:hypothetical protein